MDFDNSREVQYLADLPPAPAKPAAKWNGWSAPLRGLAAGLIAEPAAAVADMGRAVATKLSEMSGDKNTSLMDVMMIPAQLGSDVAAGPKEGQFSSEAGSSLRNVARDFRPDPATAGLAERMAYDLPRFMGKAVGYTVLGGAPGAFAMGADEGMQTADDLALQGVDMKTRMKAGAVAGAAATAGVLFPVAAPGSVLKTTGLVALGGPGAFMAQQAATRSILSSANYKELAESYDPLDPVGLVVSTLVPAAFGAYALRGGAKARPAQSESEPGPAPTAEPVKTETLTPEQADAVMTHNLTLAQDVRDATGPREANATMRGPQPRDPNQFQTNLAVVEVPLDKLRLSEDVPQFKAGADGKGVVEPLGGTFDRRGVGPIQVWERLDGSLEVISGRHRTDLAVRSGEQTIPGQIHREADGFTAVQAAALDAELNIRDGQGKVGDYVQYFQGTGITRAEADARGLLARATGQRAYAIATDGGPDLIAAHRAGQLSDEAAVAISRAGPGDARLQAVGIKAIQDGKPITQAANLMHAVRSMVEGRQDTSGDLFGFDDSAMKEAEKMAAFVSRRQRELSENLSAVQGAAKRPELAKRLGVNIKDPEGLQKRIGELQAERSGWDTWSTNPELVGRIRSDLGLDPIQLPAARKLAPDLMRMYDDAARVKPVLDARLAEVADSIGAELKLAAIKGVDRAEAKVMADYGGDATKLKDLVRGTVVVRRLGDVERALSELQSRFEVLDSGFRNGLTKPSTDPTGYRDVKLNALVDGHVVEIQINVPEMLVAKKEAHKLYERVAEIDRKATLEKRDPTAQEDAEIQSLTAQQKEIYATAWAEAEATMARNFSSEMTAPFFMNDINGNRRGSGDSQAVQTDLVSDTGTPSTSANTVPGGNDSGNSGGGFMSIDPILGENGLFNNDPGAQHKDPLTRSVLNRAAELERLAPDMVVGQDANGNPVTVKQEMERIRRESIEGTDTELGTKDAPLIEVAANCALTTGV